MSRHTPVARLLPPEHIRLPDGRVIAVKDLVGKPRDRRSYNLRTGMEHGQHLKRKIAKPVDNTP